MKIYYITYQDFPSNKANAQQTITTCKYFERNKVETTLFFPLRSKTSDDNIDNLKKFYNFDEIKFNVVGLKHFFKFEGLKYFKSFYFHFTQFTWARKSLKHIFINYEMPDFVYTRSDWVLFLLSKKNIPVVFECHQLTKSRKIILKYSAKKPNTKFVFMNKRLLNDSGVNFKFNFLIQSNGFDEDFFKNLTTIKKIENKIVFAGKLIRNNKQRGLKFIIECFKDERLQEFQLQIIGDSDAFTSFKLKENSSSNVNFVGYLNKKDTIKELLSSQIGLLVNSAESDHSLYHTDPLKYYEYSAAGLIIIAPNFPAHIELNKYKNVFLYEHENKESFIETLKNILASQKKIVPTDNVITVNSRVRNIINFLKD